MITIENTGANLVLENHPYFTFQSLTQLTQKPASYVKTYIHRLVSKGAVINLKKGVYITKRFYETHVGDNYFLPALSHALNNNSYVSLNYVLQKNNMLTDVTYNITAVTAKTTLSYTNKLGTFDYMHVRPDLFRGFEFYDYFGIRFAMASVEKALFDYLYLRPLPPSLWSLKTNIAEELRLNLSNFSTEQIHEFSEYVQLSKSKKLSKALNNFKKHVWTN